MEESHTLRVGDQFDDFESSEKHVTTFCEINYHPIRIDNKEKVQSLNKKLKKGQIDLPDDAVYACRWVCKHYGHQTASRLKLKTDARPNQAILPSGCTMSVYVAFNRGSGRYMVKSMNLVHNHPHGPSEYIMYSDVRQPTGELLEHAQLLVQNGANPILITDYVNRTGAHAKPRDIYNIKQKLAFRGTPTEELLNSLSGLDVRREIRASSDGVISCVVWSTLTQISLLQRYTDVLMLDGTYKLNEVGMPLYTIAVIDCHGHGIPVIQGLLIREDRSNIEQFLQLAKEVSGNDASIDNCTFVVDKDYAEINGIRNTFPSANILLCRFHVMKAFLEEIRKLTASSDVKEQLCKAVKRLVYGNEEKFNEALDEIGGLNAQFLAYVQKNWLPVTDLFAGYKRSSILHLDNHTNNRLERYHRTIKGIVKSCRNSVGKLITAPLRINSTLCHTTLQQDMEQRLKVQTHVPEPLKQYIGMLSSYSLQMLVSEFETASSSTPQLQTGNGVTVTFGNKSAVVTDGKCNCTINQSFGLPCRHILALQLANNEGSFDLSLVHPRWLLDNQTSVAADVGGTTAITDARVYSLTQGQRYEAAMSLLRPIASIVAQLSHSEFPTALCWLQSIELQARRGAWLESSTNDDANDDAEELLHSLHATSAVATEVVPFEDVASADRLHGLLENVQEAVQSVSDGEYVLPVETTDRDFQEPVIRLPVAIRQKGRPKTNRIASFKKSCCLFERLSNYDKALMQLQWVVSEETALDALRSGRQIQVDDLRDDPRHNVADERAGVVDLEQYFNEMAWDVVQLICHELESADWPCSVCAQAGSEPQRWIQCDHCLDWIHYICVGLKSKPRTHWYCCKCKQ